MVSSAEDCSRLCLRGKRDVIGVRHVFGCCDHVLGANIHFKIAHFHSLMLITLDFAHYARKLYCSNIQLLTAIVIANYQTLHQTPSPPQSIQ